MSSATADPGQPLAGRANRECILVNSFDQLARAKSQTAQLPHEAPVPKFVDGQMITIFIPDGDGFETLHRPAPVRGRFGGAKSLQIRTVGKLRRVWSRRKAGVRPHRLE